MKRNLSDKNNNLEIKIWIMSWFTILIGKKKQALRRSMSIYFKEIIDHLGRQKNELNS